jgi:hypothetical protein
MNDIHNIPFLTIEEVYAAQNKIELMYKRPTGDIDLLAMSNNPNLYTAWRLLRERVRKHGKANQGLPTKR